MPSPDSLQRSKHSAFLRQQLFERLPDVALIFDPASGEVMDANAAAVELLGIPREELLASTVQQLVSDSGSIFSASSGASDEVRLRMVTLKAAGALVAVNARLIRLHADGTVAVAMLASPSTSSGEQREEAAPGPILLDPLTRLPTRQVLERRLEELSHGATSGTELHAVLFLDVDGFKQVNDTFGHRAGDAVLVKLAARLQRCLRPNDLIVRYGGDEFVVLLQGLSEPSDAAMICQRILNCTGDEVATGTRTITLSVSIGIAVSGSSDLRSRDLLHEADQAMYRAKAEGGGRYATAEDSAPASK